VRGEVVSLLVVLVMSLIITRVATVALALTGMTPQAARFQARSALTGAGFTTSESERVVNHPVRRRIIMALMLIGNTGLVLAAALMVTLLAGGGEEGLARHVPQLVLLLAGLIALYVAARSAWLERVLARFIEGVLARHTQLAQRDYASLLRLGRDYRVVEMAVEAGDWIEGRTLADLQLAREGVLVLGVTRADGSYVGAPRGDATLHVDDVVMLYGSESALSELDERRAGIGGHLRHAEAVARQDEAGDEGDQGDQGDEGEDEEAERASSGSATDGRRRGVRPGARS